MRTEAEPLRHLHFGLGPLGLGFVLPFFQPRSQASLVAVIRQSSERNYYPTLEGGGTVELRYQDGTTETYSAPPIRRYDHASPQSVLEVLDGTPPQVVSCSVGVGNLDAIYQALTVLLTKHSAFYSKHALIFLPLENKSDAGTHAISHLKASNLPTTWVDDHVFAADAIVDRICSDEILVENATCHVTTERYAHFRFIFPAKTRLDPIKKSLQDLQLERFLCDAPDYEIEVRKKFWVMNGLQYALAALALRHNLTYAATIGDILQEESLQHLIARLRAEIALALYFYARSQHRDIPFGEAQRHVDTTWKRIAGCTKDTVHRLIKDLQYVTEDLRLIACGGRSDAHPPNFNDFLEKWRQRVLEPSELLLNHVEEIQAPLYHPRISYIFLEQLAKTIASLVERPSTSPPSRVGR